MHSKYIYLIKHGETEENLQGIHQGRTVGGRLSERGSNDVRNVATSLAAARITVDQMLVSPMSRCHESAALLAAALAPADIRVDERLAAKNSGHLGGRPREFAQIEASRHGVPIHQLRTPEGESSEDVQARYVRAWDEVASSPYRTTVLVGHGGGSPAYCCGSRRTASTGTSRTYPAPRASPGSKWTRAPLGSG